MKWKAEPLPNSMPEYPNNKVLALCGRKYVRLLYLCDERNKWFDDWMEERPEDVVGWIEMPWIGEVNYDI